MSAWVVEAPRAPRSWRGARVAPVRAPRNDSTTERAATQRLGLQGGRGRLGGECGARRVGCVRDDGACVSGRGTSHPGGHRSWMNARLGWPPSFQGRTRSLLALEPAWRWSRGASGRFVKGHDARRRPQGHATPRQLAARSPTQPRSRRDSWGQLEPCAHTSPSLEGRRPPLPTACPKRALARMGSPPPRNELPAFSDAPRDHGLGTTPNRTHPTPILQPSTTPPGYKWLHPGRHVTSDAATTPCAPRHASPGAARRRARRGAPPRAPRRRDCR